MPSTKENKFLKALGRANIRAAGCGCGRPKLSDVYNPTLQAKNPISQITTTTHQPHHSSSSSTDTSALSFRVDDDDDEDQCTSTTHSFVNDSTTVSSSQPSDSSTKKSESPSRRRLSTKIDDSIAVVKDSDDPYEDFRNSMLQMIVEKEIYSKEESQELLTCLLELNSRRHHDVIIRAFTEIWNEDMIHILKKNGAQRSHVRH